MLASAASPNVSDACQLVAKPNTYELNHAPQRPHPPSHMDHPLLKSGVRAGADHVLQATIQLSTRSWATPKLSESVQSKSSGSVRNLQRFLFLHKKFLTADDGGASIGLPARRATRNMWSSSRICKRVLHNKKTGALTAERYLHRCTINVIVIILAVAPVAAFHRDIRAFTIRTWPRASLNKDLFDCASVAFLRLTPEEMASSSSPRSFNCWADVYTLLTLR